MCRGGGEMSVSGRVSEAFAVGRPGLSRVAPFVTLRSRRSVFGGVRRFGSRVVGPVVGGAAGVG